jgi:hypothetical protein
MTRRGDKGVARVTLRHAATAIAGSPRRRPPRSPHRRRRAGRSWARLRVEKAEWLELILAWLRVPLQLDRAVGHSSRSARTDPTRR